MRYPSITALRALEAVARLGSVSAAARELNLTRSAVSHQLSLLETNLGFALTEPAGRGIVLTFQGHRFAREASRVLKILREASRWDDGEEMVGQLNISCTPGLATYWLCQYMNEFMHLYPKLGLNICSPRTPDDTSNADVDIHISYGTGNWPEMDVSQLLTLQLFPVCSPRLANQLGGLKNPQQLLALPLLHLVNQTDWRVWLAAAGLKNFSLEQGITFSDAHYVQAAAMAGQGVAIGDNMLSGDALDKGLLVQPFATTIEAPATYYIVTSPEKTDRRDVQAFIGWIQQRVTESIALWDSTHNAP